MRTIGEFVLAAGTFTEFVSLLKAGSLLDTLRMPGPYTVFAPTDDAFARIESTTVRALHRNIRKLKAVLAYHIVSGKLALVDLADGERRTVEGSSILVASDAGHVTVNGARITRADIFASNGFIHVIDSLLIPRTAALVAANA